MDLLEVKSISKTYGSGETAVHALKKVSFSVPKGEYVAIVGESGSGKSTLLNMIGALDNPTSGKVLIDGKDIFAMKESKLTTKMITAEAVTYAVYGTIAGTALGLILHYLIYVKIVISHFGGFWNIPFTTIGIVLLLVVFSCIIAVHGPTKRMRDMAITDTINDL